MSYEYKGAFACLPQMERGRACVLGADPKGKNFLYCSGRYVFIRDVNDPSEVDIYGEHSLPTCVAKYSPSGFYIASSDVSGKIRIWDTTQKEHILKYEYQPFCGMVRDISWSPDSKRLVIVGQGNKQFGAAIMFDTGTSVGTIGYHSKEINSCDYRPVRPFRVATASEDYQAALHEGPPFKFLRSFKDHGNFVQVARFSPDGKLLATAGSDGKVFLYEGKTGELVKSLGEKAHTGSVFGLCFSPDGSQLMTCSGDKSVKIWDVESASELIVFKMGKNIEDMQQACLWMGDNLISVSFSGEINFLDKNNPDTPLRVLSGHINNITALAISNDKSAVYTGSHDGRICKWNPNTGEAVRVSGSGHTSQVCAMESIEGTIVTAGFDDKMRFVNHDTGAYDEESVIAMESQPKDLSCGKDGLIAVACEDQVAIFRNGNRVFLQKEDYRCMSVSIHPNQTDIAVGGSDNKIHIYNLEGDTLKQVNQLTTDGEIDAVAYSPDGAYLCSGSSVGTVNGWKVAESYQPIKYSWTFHGRSRIQKIAWSPDSHHFASCALDSVINVWEVNTSGVVIKIAGAHQGSNITGLEWLSENMILSAGYDKCVRRWQISFS